MLSTRDIIKWDLTISVPVLSSSGVFVDPGIHHLFSFQRCDVVPIVYMSA